MLVPLLWAFVTPCLAEDTADPLAASGGLADASAASAFEVAAATSEAHRSRIERTWFASGNTLAVRAAKTRKQALEVGARNVEPAARVLMQTGSAEQALSHRRLAARLAPDLPIAHVALARQCWEAGDYRDAVVEIGRGALAIPRHLDASIWLLGSLLMMLAMVMIAGPLLFIAIAGGSRLATAAHDAGDLLSRELPAFARAALICTLLLLPTVLGEGVIGLLLVLFAIGFVYGQFSQRLALGLAVMLLVLGLYPVLQLSGSVLSAPDADPVASAGLAVVRGVDTPSQVEILRQAEGRGDQMAAQLLALRARRVGADAEARDRYRRLLAREATDPIALTALGNMSFRAGRTAEAIDYYERAQAVQDSALLMFDLSQAYAKAFRMEEFERSLERAQVLGASLVEELSQLGDTSFVADLPYPIAPIRDRMLAAADGSAFSAAAVRVLAPGRMGESWLHFAGAFLGCALLCGILGGRYQHASRCGRCGRRICARCDGSIWSSDLCDGCHHVFNRPQDTDPALRMARLQELRSRESRVEKLYTLISLVLPGASGLLAKRPDLCFLGIHLFACAVVLLVWRNGVVPDPLTIGGAGSLAFVLAGCVMALLYVAVLISGLIIRRSS